MDKEELEKEAINRVDSFIDSFSQDIRSTLHDRLNQEDVKDFLYSLYIDIAEPREKENAELKRDKEDLIFVRNQKADHINELKDLLTKAKDIIKKFSEFVNNEIEYDPEHPQEHTELWNELCEQAKQFLKEIEK